MSKSVLRSISFVMFLLAGAFVAWAGGPAEKQEDSITSEPVSQQSMEMSADSQAGRYRQFTEADFAAASDQVRIYFFHASWCPTCRSAERNFTANHSQIPEGVVVFQIDYDDNAALKREYGVTYQHTFVVVDSAGVAIQKWSGGDVADVVKNTADLL